MFSDGFELAEEQQISCFWGDWEASAGFHQTPTLYDDVAVACAIDPAQCPVSPMGLEVDGKGFTRPVSGPLVQEP
jgi:hypothetical protein